MVKPLSLWQLVTTARETYQWDSPVPVTRGKGTGQDIGFQELSLEILELKNN